MKSQVTLSDPLPSEYNDEKYDTSRIDIDIIPETEVIDPEQTSDVWDMETDSDDLTVDVDSMPVENMLVDENIKLQDSVNLPFPSLPKGNGCVICCNASRSLQKLPDKAKLDIFVRYGVWSPPESLCCKIHLEK